MIKKIILLIVLTFLSDSFVSAQNTYVGTTGMNFLKIDTDVIASGMGGAFVAKCDNVVGAMYWNPAGLANLKYNEIVIQSSLLYAGINQTIANFAHPFNNRSAMGVSINYINYSFDNFPVYDVMAMFGYGISLGKGINAGGNVKYIYDRIDTSIESVLAFDLGILWSVSDRLNIGANITNLGTALDVYTLPFSQRLGILVKSENGKRSFTTDILLQPDSHYVFRTGYEVLYDHFENYNISLRIGFNSKQFIDQGIIGGLSTGAGISWDRFKIGKIGFNSFEINYAFIPNRVFGLTHRIALRFKF